MSQATVHPGSRGPPNRADLVQGFARIHLIAGPAWAGLYLTLLPGRWLGAALGGAVALGAGYAWWASRRDQLLVRGNTTQLTQLIFNLALNGAQAMPDGGVLEIEVVRVGPFVRLRVTDTGVGMSDEVLANIFQPLFSTKPAGEGSGLGMTVVEHIVGAHGASLEVRSRLDLGTTMTVEFPAAAPV